MENTLENRFRFYAQYWGVDCFMFYETHPCTNIVDSKFLFEGEDDEKTYLVLKPLSTISDEDAIYVAKIIEPTWKSPVITYNDSKCVSIGRNRPNYGHTIDLYSDGTLYCEYKYDSDCFLMAYDYLRSKGYALPYMGLSVEKIIEYGWIKLK